MAAVRPPDSKGAAKASPSAPREAREGQPVHSDKGEEACGQTLKIKRSKCLWEFQDPLRHIDATLERWDSTEQEDSRKRDQWFYGLSLSNAWNPLSSV